MVAAQAGVSLENAMLYDEIRQLFEGFVKASVEAIESRDPTTSGHSRRVADLTVGAREGRRRARRRGPYRGRARSRARTCASSSTRACSTTSARSASARRCSSRRRSSTTSGSSSSARASTSSRGRSRPTSSRARSRALERGAPRERARGARRRARASAAPSSTASWDAIVAAPTSRPCSRSGDFARIEALAQRDLRRPARRGAARCSTDDEVDAPQVSARLAHDRRSSTRSARTSSHTFQFLSQHPVGQGVPARRRSSPARTTSASTARATRTASAPRRSRSSRR